MRIANPPSRLWLRGDPDAFASPCVALVGTRAASRYGLEVAEQLGADLARAGMTVVSGLARGIDSAAHRGALTTGRTVAVLGSGADVIYPAEHAELADRIVQNGGAILSELPPGSPPRPRHFPRRNRLISGISLAVVVIEASARSGALQTAHWALQQGRPILAVPGSILGGGFRGSHALLRDGAKLVESAADILKELHRPEAVAAGAAGHEVKVHEPHPVLAAMTEGCAYDVQELIVATGLPVTFLLRELLRLEVAGRVLRTGGPRYIRTSVVR